MGDILVMLLDVLSDLWISKRLGPAATCIPSGYRRYHPDTDGVSLSQIHFA